MEIPSNNMMQSLVADTALETRVPEYLALIYAIPACLLLY